MLMLSAIVISAGGKMEAGAVAAVAMAVEMVELQTCKPGFLKKELTRSPPIIDSKEIKTYVYKTRSISKQE